MARSATQVEVYLEIGERRTFAGALDWPGWSRSGREEESALQALLAYGSRYAAVLRQPALDFRPPTGLNAFTVVERLEGNATTDFGAPAIAPSFDSAPLDEGELRRLQALLQACWQASDSAARLALGKELRKGARGGGRSVEGILQHVFGAEVGYLAQVGWKFRQEAGNDPGEGVRQARQAILSALAAAARRELPERGPRGGLRWTPRYFARRVAWHTLDHAWEIEDRLT